MAGTFDAVIFDCDGVLVDSEILAIEVELALLADEGLDYELADFKARFLGLSDRAFCEALDADCQLRLGRALREDFLDLTHQGRRAAVRSRLQAVTGAAEAVAAFNGPRAVASSTGVEFLRMKLELTGLWTLFDPHAYSADLVPHAKPAPDIFLHAAREIGVAPGRCLVLEDSANGVLAGRAAGMRVWAFTGGSHCDDATAEPLLKAGAERVVCSWPDAADLFRQA